jgi:hypothetical protein
MDIFAREILIAVVGNGAWFLLGFLAYRVYTSSFHRAPYRLLFGFADPTNVKTILGTPLGIVPNTLRLERDEGMPIFGLGPLTALQRLSALMKAAYPKSKDLTPIPSRFAVGENLRCDLLLLGYPAGNEITRRVFEAMSLPLIFSDHNIIDAATGEIQFSAKVVDGKVLHDYGMIVRAQNPFDPQSIIFVFAGAETYGVKAAADFLSLRNFGVLLQTPIKRPLALAILSRFFTFKWRNKEYFQAIVECDVVGHSTQTPKLVRYQELDAASLVATPPPD